MFNMLDLLLEQSFPQTNEQVRFGADRVTSSNLPGQQGALQQPASILPGLVFLPPSMGWGQAAGSAFGSSLIHFHLLFIGNI